VKTSVAVCPSSTFVTVTSTPPWAAATVVTRSVPYGGPAPTGVAGSGVPLPNMTVAGSKKSHPVTSTVTPPERLPCRGLTPVMAGLLS